MQIELAYGDGIQTAEIPDDSLLGVLEPKEMPLLEDLTGEARRILEESPLAGRLAEAVPDGGKVVIVVPDKTRKAMVHLIAPAVVEFLLSRGVKEERLSFLFALGRHAKMTEVECRAILGDKLYDGFACEQSVALQPDFVHAGTTSFGNEVHLHRRVMEADALFGINKTFFHYFAGFGGGRKLLLPGVASEETVLYNHGLMVNTVPEGKNPECRSGSTQKNPIHLDMLEGAKLAPEIFILNLIADHRGRPAALFGGGLEESHDEACAALKENLTCPVGEAADFVVASCGGHPYDINFLQSHKGLDNAFRAVKPGGTLILLAQCPDGWGSTHLRDWVAKRDLSVIEGELRKEYESHGQTAHAILEKTTRARCILVSDLTEDDTRLMGMEKARDLTDALRMIPGLDSSRKGFLLPWAASTLPVS